MDKGWAIPDYRYDRATTLSTLFAMFLAHNGNDLAGFGRDVGVSEDVLIRWKNGVLTPGLKTKLKRRFEELTHISLERLYVIMAWRDVMSALDRVEELTHENPSYARLLLRDPGQLRASLVGGVGARFQDGIERAEVVQAIREATRETGVPQIALQIGVDDRYVAKWMKEGLWLPSDEMLARCLVGVALGFYSGHPDTVRFQVAADALLGVRFEEVIGCRTFPEAVARLLDPWRDRAPTIIANKTGLGGHAVENLLTYEPRRGNIPYDTIVKVLRGVFVQKHPDRAEEFGALSAQFVQQARHGALTLLPMQLGERVQVPSANPPLPSPSSPPAPPAPSAPTPMPVKQDEGAVLSAAAALLAARGALDAQLEALRLQHPDMLAHLPRTGGSQPQPKPAARSIETQLTELIDQIEQICGLPEDERATLLSRLDPHLVALQQIIEAAGTKQPVQYLKMVRSGRPAELVGQSPHR